MTGRKPRWLDETHDASNRLESKDATAKLRLTPADPIPLATEPPDELPTVEARRYAILGEIAHGGLGRILAAEDRTLNRRVAIKELLENRGHARFLREAMVTARLQHPSIVPLYDVGRWPSGEPYYSMRLVSGRPFDAVIAATKSLDERLALLPHVIAVADAMAYAHSEKIIHRDLKPANVLVGEFGETVVIDWGLAKDLGSNEPDPEEGPYRMPHLPMPLTQAGEVLGTPVYMAPEQAMGKELDQRADVYAIGAILYELLTGKWPHHGATTEQVIERLTAGNQVTPLEVRQPDVPPDLAAIVGKAMTHDPAARYPSAAELAADLRRFQTGQLVAAHRYTRATLVSRWVRRHRAVVAVASALLVVLAVTATVSVRSIVRERNATRVERDRLILANAAGELARDPTAAVAWLKTYPAAGAERERARSLALDARARGVAKHVLPRDTVTTMGRFSPDGRFFAQPDPAGLRVIDLATGATVGPRRRANALQWSPDSARIAIASWSAPHEIALVELASGTVTPLSGERSGRWPREVFSRDGQTFVLPAGGSLRRFDGTGKVTETVWAPFTVTGFARHEDRFVAMSGGALTWWDRVERVAHPLQTPEGITLATSVTTYALLGEGTSVAAGTTDGRLCIWSLADGSVRVLDGHGAPITELTASRDGKHAVTLADDSSLRSWSIATGESRALPKLGEITDIDLADDGRALVVGLGDHRIVLVDPGTGDQHQIGRHGSEVLRVDLAPDGKWVASDSEDGTTRLWQLRSEPFDQLAKGFGVVAALATSPDGRVAIAGGDRSTVLLWTADRRIVLPGHAEGVTAVSVSADGRHAAAGGKDQKIHIWEVATGAAGPVLDASGPPLFLAMTRDGRKVVASHAGGDIRVWDVETRTSRLLATIRDAISPALSPDDRSVAVGERDGSLSLFSIDGGPARRLNGSDGMVDFVQFSPDGRHVAGGSSSQGKVRVWDVATGTARELGRRKGGVESLAFSSDGRWLAAASTSGDVGLWDLTTSRERTLHHGRDVLEVAFLADGLVTGGIDGAIRVWGFDGSERSMLRVDGAVMTLDTRDRVLFAGTSAGELYRWPVAALGSPPAQLASRFLDSLTYARLDAQSKLASP
jgi:WD40 repeat protein